MNIKNERGYTLVTVLLVIMLLTVLGGAYILAMNFEVRESYRHDNRVQAYYYSRSGVEAASEWLITNQSDYFKLGPAGNIMLKDGHPENIGTDPETGSKIIEFDLTNGLDINSTNNQDFVRATIWLEEETYQEGQVEEEVLTEIRIESTGRFREAIETSILVMNKFYETGESGAFDNAVYANADVIATANAAYIKGNVRSGGRIEGNIDPESTITPDSYLFYESPNEHFYNLLDDAEDRGSINAGNQDVFEPHPDDLTSFEGGDALYYDSITTQPKGSLTWQFNCNEEGPLVILVDEIDSKGIIDVECLSGENCSSGGEDDNCFAVMFIMNDSTLQTPKSGNSVPLFIFLADDVNLTLIAGSTFNGYIYGPNASVSMISDAGSHVGDNEGDIDGAIIVNELRRHGSEERFMGEIYYENFPAFNKYFEETLKLGFYEIVGIRRGTWK